jgi:predicted nucleic acid-binding protein
VSAIVIDASIAVAWCFEDEASPEADRILDRVRRHGARVPALWYLEVANVLRQAERRKRILPADTAARLDLLSRLPIAADTSPAIRAWSEILDVARSQTLTAYDAAYVELAMRQALPIASTDRELTAAAERLGLAVITA